MDGLGQLLPEISEQDRQIDEALARGVTVLTGNQRAARTLHHRFDLRNRDLGFTHWESPSIFAWDTWTAHLWHDLLIDGHATQLLLNRAQEHILWRDLIAADPESIGLRTPDALAELAADAYTRLCAYRGESRLRTAGVSADTRAFQRWAQSFERRCRTANYLPQAQLEATLAVKPLTRNPSGYILIGFDTFTPAQQHLLDFLNIPTPTLSPFAEGGEPAFLPATLVPAPDEPAELRNAARWIRHRLEQYPAQRPCARIALIVPGLEDHRARIDRTLRQILAPELEDITASAIDPFEFSLGIPLAQTPLAATALQLLQWAIAPLSLENIGQLLQSPYFAGNFETIARAEFDAHKLRRIPTLRPELTLEALLRITESSSWATRLPHLIHFLKDMYQSILFKLVSKNETRLAADWADLIRAFLEAAGWAGTRPDDSLEFQTRRKWESLLDELATLDFEGIRLTFPDTLASLTRLARQTLFAPESRNAPVQVMSPQEAAGSTFDALWFLRAGDLTWPQPPSSSPLLAFHLQRELHMPGANPAEDAAHARRITERILASAPTVLVSYAQRAAEGTQRLSSTLTGLTKEAPADLLPPEPPQVPIPLETIDDNPTLPSPPDIVLRGGATLLKLQAACGFRAFAEQRLSAAALDTAEPGMDARERGDTVHLALQHFWQEVKDQATLRSLTTEARQATLDRAIEAALQKTQNLAASDWEAAYLDVQRQRLRDLLDPWLLAELGRTVPFTVRLQETELKDARIGPLRLTLRVDRIDSTEFGDVILDYKTGAASPAAWLTDRPDEPQLPLYAILAPNADHLAGVAFAQVRPGKDRSLTGYQTQEGILLKETKLKTATLSDQLEDWHRILTQLAEDFHRGDLRVRPKSYPTTCEYCAQRILCRLDITTLEDPNPDEEQEPENA